MFKVLILGAGKIGAAVACLLHESGSYEVTIVDVNLAGSDVKRLQQIFPEISMHIINVNNAKHLADFLAQHPMDAMVSCLPFYCNLKAAQCAKEANIHYFDLTEDVAVTADIKTLAANAEKAFVPQCGLAPGFIGIVANALMQQFTKIREVKLRVGALPTFADNALHYSLTWSTEGLINEYLNPCQVIINGLATTVAPLHDLETLEIDGQAYEAFNTSGGLGSLVLLGEGCVENMNYKTIRYPGHCEKMQFLLKDMKLERDRSNLKKILEEALPKTYQDVVIVYVAVNGIGDGDFLEETFEKKIYPQTIAGIRWSAIQITTAASVCAVLDLVLKNPDKYHGFVYQEQLPLASILGSPFGLFFK